MESNLLKVAEVAITYKSIVKPSERPKISSSNDAYQCIKPFFKDCIEHHEEFWMLMLNRNNKVIGAYCVGKGGSAGCVADPKIVFQAAIKANAQGIIVVHNHPSGNLTASQADINITNRLKQGGDVLEIRVMDHLIITEERYFSFADEGML